MMEEVKEVPNNRQTNLVHNPHSPWDTVSTLQFPLLGMLKNNITRSIKGMRTLVYFLLSNTLVRLTLPSSGLTRWYSIFTFILLTLAKQRRLARNCAPAFPVDTEDSTYGSPRLRRFPSSCLLFSRQILCSYSFPLPHTICSCRN